MPWDSIDKSRDEDLTERRKWTRRLHKRLPFTGRRKIDKILKAARISDDPYVSALGRMWPERNNESVAIFANGHEHGRKQRRESVRQNLGCQRRARERERLNAEKN